MKDELDILEEIKKKVNNEIVNKYGKERASERYLYSIPYKAIPITSPQRSNELPIILDDVILVVKEKIINQYSDTIKSFDLYNKDCQKIAEADQGELIKFDREIMDDLIKDKIKIIEEAGYEAAGVDEKSRIESYFEILGRKLVVMNEKQKERLDNSNNRRLDLSKISKENIDPEEDNDKDKDLDNKMVDEQARNQLKENLDIDVLKITKIRDNTFFENNPDIKTRNAYAVLTRNGQLVIVGENDGKFEKVDGFENSTDVSGRTIIARNDESKFDEKNTYGSIDSTRNKDYRYTLELGDYGEIKLIEQRRLHNGHMEEKDKFISREIETNNTSIKDLNLEGNNNVENITRRTFDARSANSDSKYYGKGGISEDAKAIKKHGHAVDFTMEGLAADESLRINEALEMINEELKKRGVSLNSREEQNLKESVKAYIGDSENVFCEKTAIEYANDIEQTQKNREKIEKQDGGRSRLEEAKSKRFGS